MGHTACTEPQCLYKGALYLYLFYIICKGYFGATKLVEVIEASVNSVPETYCWDRGDVQATPHKSCSL